MAAVCASFISSRFTDAQRGGDAMARWRGGAVARWRGGAVTRWRGGAVRGGAVARWRGGSVAKVDSRLREPGFESRAALMNIGQRRSLHIAPVHSDV